MDEKLKWNQKVPFVHRWFVIMPKRIQNNFSSCQCVKINSVLKNRPIKHQCFEVLTWIFRHQYNQPKSHILIHKNGSLRDFYIMTLVPWKNLTFKIYFYDSTKTEKNNWWDLKNKNPHSEIISIHCADRKKEKILNRHVLSKVLCFVRHPKKVSEIHFHL